MFRSKALSVTLVLLLVFSLTPTAHGTAGRATFNVTSEKQSLSLGESEDVTDIGAYLATDYNTPNNISWSLTTLDGRSINQSTYRGKTIVFIFYRANGACMNSNGTIRSLAESEWISDDNIVIIAVEGDRTPASGTKKEVVTTFKNTYAPDCDDIVFAYDSGDGGNRMLWDYVRKTLNTNLITFAVNVIIDADNNIRYVWESNYNAQYFQAHLATLIPDLAFPDIDPTKTYLFDIGGTFDYEEASDILALLNKYRTDAGRSPLAMDEGLTNAAMQRAAELSIYFNHTRPNGGSYSSVVQRGYAGMSENISMGYKDASDAMNGWASSTGHRNNMLLSSHTIVGIGCFYQADGTKYWVQLFAHGTPAIKITESGKLTRTARIQAIGGVLKLGLSPSSETMQIGDSEVFSLINIENAGNAFARATGIIPSFYESDRLDVAVIDADGRVTSTGVGTTTIKLGINPEFYAEATVNVTIAFTEKPSSWAELEVSLAIVSGLVPQDLQKNFKAEITRGEVAQMFINLIETVSGLPIDTFMAEKGVTVNNNVFTDTNDNAVLAANALGIIQGVGGNNFDPEGVFTRASIAVIANRVARVLGINTEGYTHAFEDLAGHWASPELGWPVHAGIVEGIGEGLFDPDEPLTTEMAIVFTYRALAPLTNEKVPDNEP